MHRGWGVASLILAELINIRLGRPYLFLAIQAVI